ncbi:hypothetical protein [Paenibacillus cremeus]|uniref:Uncharacterized protein n=1 Tax=Paenibacillus cremeus TaxID=2163881 RepID=A0A559JET6_9BACL|nr:hypothetical protein [Paenibacillus cremeus]TVX98380.1 hypothetical protein FPZ49_34520 [Paenibacillus cremeus]
MENTKSQLTWRNLLNTEKQSTQTLSVEITFDQDISEEEAKQFIFNALTKYAQSYYLDPEHEGEKAKPTVIKVQ